jgi:hypothetical protein
MGGLTHYWLSKSPLVVRSRCGGVEVLRSKARDLYQGPECAACWEEGDGSTDPFAGQEEEPVLCAVPLGNLSPLRGFIMDAKEGGVFVGVVERIPSSRGYVTVMYADPRGGRRHNFKDREGDPVEFVDGGFRRAEWSAGTLVRPLLEDDGMSDEKQIGLVEAPGGPAPSADNIKATIANMKAKVAAKIAKPVGKPKAGNPVGKPKGAAKPVAKAKTPKEPKEQRPCLCACGGTTGGKFVPGHDARVKGWFKKIAAGDEEFTFNKLPKSLQKLVVDVKGVKKALTRPIKELGD